MTASTSTASAPQQGKKTARPSVWRLLASKYVDLLICGFISWILCFTFGWQVNWPTVTLFLWVGQIFWCRDRLNPTAGEYCLGIRYLTSASSQVVADIQVINPKLKLNGYLLVAGVVELTLSILFFSGWTFVGKVAAAGFVLSGSLSLAFWTVTGFAFFICAAYLLSGSKMAFWVVPVVHVVLAAELFRSYPIWRDLLQSDLFYTPWVWGVLVNLGKTQSFFFLELFGSWSLFLIGVLALSRKHLVN
jgi:hypothetical protein